MSSVHFTLATHSGTVSYTHLRRIAVLQAVDDRLAQSNRLLRRFVRHNRALIHQPQQVLLRIAERFQVPVSYTHLTNNTAAMLMTVAGDEQAIGYVSLGSLNDTVKAVSYTHLNTFYKCTRSSVG